MSYLGDTHIGTETNIGAGTITCNYDGANKHQTVIEDGVFIGSNSQLVAPIKIGKYATIGAGSTITMDVPSEKLTDQPFGTKIDSKMEKTQQKLIHHYESRFLSISTIIW